MAVVMQSATFVDSSITACSSGNAAGAVLAQDTDLVFRRVAVTNCTARTNGGGILPNFLTPNSRSFLMEDSVISGCRALTGVGGGVALDRVASVRIAQTTIDGCTAASVGGGVFIQNTGTLTLAGVTIAGGSAPQGSALFANGGATVTACNSV